MPFASSKPWCAAVMAAAAATHGRRRPCCAVERARGQYVMPGDRFRNGSRPAALERPVSRWPRPVRR